MTLSMHRILLVDDDLDEQFLTKKELLKIAGVVSVQVAGSGNEAIQYLIGEGEFSDRKRFPFPSIIITDLSMPDGDGFDVLEFLQHNPEWSVAPRIMLSNSDANADVRTAFSLGVSAYHIKPTNPVKGQELLRQILEYWSKSLVPPVDEQGRLLISTNVGRRTSRFPQKQAGVVMTRPKPRS